MLVNYSSSSPCRSCSTSVFFCSEFMVISLNPNSSHWSLASSHVCSSCIPTSATTLVLRPTNRKEFYHIYYGHKDMTVTLNLACGYDLETSVYCDQENYLKIYIDLREKNNSGNLHAFLFGLLLKCQARVPFDFPVAHPLLLFPHSWT